MECHTYSRLITTMYNGAVLCTLGACVFRTPMLYYFLNILLNFLVVFYIILHILLCTVLGILFFFWMGGMGMLKTDNLFE